jgi:hypothetical protein
MNHANLYKLRETYNAENISLCFNGPFSQGLIEEIGSALKNYLQNETASPSSTMDVFAVYIEVAQNIQHYSARQGYSEADASATVVIGRTDNDRYVISAGNIVEAADGQALHERVLALATMDKTQLKAAYKEQMRKPRDENADGAGLGLIDMARKTAEPVSSSLYPVNDGKQYFFSLRVVI